MKMNLENCKKRRTKAEIQAYVLLSFIDFIYADLALYRTVIKKSS